jgi:hypothetical protein
MDKLELDGRVARLERRVSLLSATIFGLLALIGVAALLAVVARSEARPYVATPSEFPAPAPVPMVEPPAPPPHVFRDMGPGSVGELSLRLHELEDVRNRDLITPQEYQAKKDQLLGRPLNPSDLKSDLEQLGELLARQTLTPAEHEALKARVLEITR